MSTSDCNDALAAQVSRSPRLGALLGTNDNNFNLIRMLAAVAVLVSHSFTVVTGNADNEPMRVRFGITPGSIAVDVFFVISGMLVTKSICTRSNALEFIKARFLRIWPGLIVALLLTVFVVGPLFTRHAPGVYFGLAQTWHYLFRNVLLFRGVDHFLPGVFSHNPAGGGVNASLWTLPLEVRMYSYLLLVWIASRVAWKFSGAAFSVLIAVGVAYYGSKHFVAISNGLENSPVRLPFFFFVGAAVYVLRERIILNRFALLGVLALIGIASLKHQWFYASYSLGLWYVIFALAFLPRGFVRRYNAIGDYSYGIYIYAWPIQQMLIARWPHMSIPLHIVLTLVGTLLMAVPSWHLIEKPFLRWRRSRKKPACDAAAGVKVPDGAPLANPLPAVL